MPLLFSVFFICVAPLCLLFPYTTLFRSPRTSFGSALLINILLPLRPRRWSGMRGWTSSYPTICSATTRSEEHTSELQSPYDLVCRLLLEKKKRTAFTHHPAVTSISLPLP